MRIALYADDGTIVYNFSLGPLSKVTEVNDCMQQLMARMKLLVQFEKQRDDAEAKKNKILVLAPGSKLADVVKEATHMQAVQEKIKVK